MIKQAGKWASAWNSEGMGTNEDPVWKGITRESCVVAMDSYLAIGANASLSLQTLAVAFFAEGHNPFKPPPPGPPPPPPGPRPPPPLPPPPPPPQPLPGCSFKVLDGFCARGTGEPVILTRLHTSQITCCKLCMADPACKSWTLDSTNASICACYLQASVPEPSVGHNATGCTSGVPHSAAVSRSPALPRPAVVPRKQEEEEAFFSQNNTIAAFVIARGAGGGFLELPVCGAFESMADYDLSNPLLKAELGTPLGAGKQTTPGSYAREFTKATVSLDCATWRSTFVMK